MIIILALALALPNGHLTPGSTRPAVTLLQVCTPGVAQKARVVSATTKRKVFLAYGLAPSNAYELDHLIPLELGGSNEAANLWPQPYAGTMNAHDKDRVENRLHALVCAGKVLLVDAQHAMATDWVAALKTYGGQSGPR